ncbi:MAG: hypothetical protein ACK2US_00910 [Anaerolineae bacterium]|jgi:hypothetical protein
MKESFKFLAPEQIRYLAEMAEQARAALSQFAGYEVFYDSVALQLLDEWIDRHLRQFPEPSQRIRLLWVSFLGEMFRRHQGGEWALRGQGSKEGGLVVLCPTESSGVYTADVSGQIGRRIIGGMSASLAYYFAITSIEVKAG